MRRILALLFAAGCSRELTVPAPAAPPAVVFTSFSPAEAWAGQRVFITGEKLGNVSETEVRFGSSGRVAPSQVSDDGTSLEVLVPDDATDGPVSVSTSLGTAASTAAFHFDGLGRLRQGAITTSVDLRMQLDGLMITDGDNFESFSAASYWAGSYAFGRGAWRPLPVRKPAALAWAAANRQEIFVDLDTTGCPGAVARVVFPFVDTPAPVCLMPPPGLGFVATGQWSLATSDDNAQVVAASATSLWSIDLGGASPAVTRLDTASTNGALLAWIAAGEFLVFEDSQARVLKFPATFGAPLDAVADTAVAVHARPGLHRVAWCADQNDAFLLDTSVDPPVAVAGQSGLLYRDCSGIALSADGTRLAVAQPEENTVSILDVTGSSRWPVLSSISVESPRQIDASANAFEISGRGGVTALSIPTGAPLTFTALHAGLRAPVVRTVAGNEVVEVPRGDPDTLVRLSPALTPLEYTGGQRELPLEQPFVTGAITDAKRAWLLHGWEVRLLDDATQVESPTQRWAPADYDSVAQPVAGATSSVLWFRYNAGSRSTPDFELALLDPSDLTKAPKLLPVADDDLFFPASVVGGYVIDHAQVRKLDGTVVTPLSGKVVWALAAQSAVFVFTSSDGVSIDDTLRIGPQAIVHGRRFPAWKGGEGDEFALSASGTRLYALRGTGAERRLVTVRFDPDEGTATDELGSIPVPASTQALTPYDAGQRMTAIAPADDRVLLFE